MIYLERDFTMFKKVMKFIFLSLVLSLFIACGGETTTESTTTTMTSTTESTTIGYVLPDLSNKTRLEISGVLNDLGVDFSFQKETSTTIVEDTFIRYEGFSIGDIISPEQSVVVIIATEDLILPDLSGQSQTEILSTLLNLGINFRIEIITDNDVPDQTFSSYGDGLEANDTIPTSFQVTVYVGYNSETLPDLTDKLKNEIIGILEEKNIVFEFNYITDDLYPEDSFAGYEDRTIGDFYEEGTVTVNLYKNTFTDNETSLVISKYVDGGDDTSNLNYFQELDEVDILTRKKSLVFILDTVASQMLNEIDYLNYGKLVLIDHHQNLPDIDYNYYIRDVDASSTAEIVTNFLLSLGVDINKDSARALYMGIIGDTGRFMYNSTTSNTLLSASKLLDIGIDIQQIHNLIYLETLENKRIKSVFFSTIELTKNNVAYRKNMQDFLDEYILNPHYVSRGLIGQMAGIKEIPIWANFTIDKDNDKILCELRSREKPVLEVAKKYGGGGHLLACGCSVKTWNEVDLIIKDLDKLV